MSIRRRKSKGTSIVESALAAILLVPIALAILDLIVIVVANSMNDTACKNAARAAANQSEGAQAFNAAKKSLESSKASTIVKSIVFEIFDWQGLDGNVTCSTKMVVRLPVPFPGMQEISFVAKDVEAVVGAKNPNAP